jgi:hypothetical protein
VIVFAWERLLEQSHSCGHFVQLYEVERALGRNVGVFFWEGLRRGGSVLAITTPGHRKLFEQELQRLGANVADLREGGRLLFLDAQSTLAQVTLNGQPEWARFEETIRAALRNFAPSTVAEDLRAYGEMVGILWNARQYAAAVRLEQLWNKLLESAHFSLYCAYAIDVFGNDFQAANLECVLRAHTHVMPGEIGGALEAALHRSMNEILGPHADELRSRTNGSRQPGWAIMPNAEWMILWLRENLPAQADSIVRRARDYYEQLPRISPLPALAETE